MNGVWKKNTRSQTKRLWAVIGRLTTSLTFNMRTEVLGFAVSKAREMTAGLGVVLSTGLEPEETSAKRSTTHKV
jgi:glycogen synthase